MSSLTEKVLIIGVAYFAWQKFFPVLALATPSGKAAASLRGSAQSAQSLLAPLGSENPENLLQLGTPLAAASGSRDSLSLPLSNPTNPVEVENSFQGAGPGLGSGAPTPSGFASGAGDQGPSAGTPSGSVSLGFDVGKGLDGAATGGSLGLAVAGIPGAIAGAIAGFFGYGIYGGSSISGEGQGGSSSGSASGASSGGGFDGAVSV